MGRLIYAIYAAAMLGGLAWTEYRGWGMEPTSEAHDVPRSVRNNPGAYRPLYYYGSGRYLHGK